MSPQQPQTPQKATTFTDHEALSDAIDDWELRNWHFNAFVLVVPSAEAPYMVAGTNPLACQLLADNAVRTCCNASQRFKGAWDSRGALSRNWTGTVCDMSALRKERHPRNRLAEAILTAIAVGDSLASYDGPLYGTVGFHLTGELPQVIESERAVRMLKMAAEVWGSNPNPSGAR
jgi:hypothetical protein